MPPNARLERAQKETKMAELRPRMVKMVTVQIYLPILKEMSDGCHSHSDVELHAIM
jgi:hypothetical protein